MTTTTHGDTIRAAVAALEAQAARPTLPAWLAPAATPGAPALDDTTPRAGMARAGLAIGCARLAMELGEAASRPGGPDPEAVGQLVRQLVRQALALGVACGADVLDGAPCEDAPPGDGRRPTPKRGGGTPAPLPSSERAAILRAVAELGQAQAGPVAEAVGMTQKQARAHLRAGIATGSLARPARGIYTITDAGRAILATLEGETETIPDDVLAAPLALRCLWWADAHEGVLISRVAAPALGMTPTVCAQTAHRLMRERRMSRIGSGTYRITEAGRETLRDRLPLDPSPPLPSDAPQPDQAPAADLAASEGEGGGDDTEDAPRSTSADDFDLGPPVRLPPPFPGRPLGTQEHVITVCGLPVSLRRVCEHDADGWRVTLPDGRSEWKPCRESAARWAQRMMAGVVAHQEAA